MRTEPPTGDELTRLLVSMKRNVLEQVAHEPQTALKRSPLPDRVIALLLGVALLLGLGAGAAFAFGIVPSPVGAPSGTAPDSTPTPTSTPTSTPVPTRTPPPSEYAVVPADTWEQPASRYGLDCETMIDESLVTALFTSAVAPADPIVNDTEVDTGIPRLTSILSEGGTVCEWKNGVAGNYSFGAVPGYVGVVVSVLPRPAEGWSELAAAHGMPGDGSRCEDFGCWAMTAVGDAWVTIEVLGEPNELNRSGWEPFLAAVTEAVSDAGSATAPTTSERKRAPLPADCNAFLPLDTVRAISSMPEAELRERSGGWSEWAEARRHAGNVGCHWGWDDGGYAASVQWVRDGRWAYDRMMAPGTVAPLELAGLDSSDEAAIRCNEMVNTYCTVDLAVGPDWLNVGGADRETAIALAEAVLEQLAP